jgi:proprotein convertase subtilisin/kexin type 5
MEQCPSNYYPLGTVCSQCPTGCLKCESAMKCFACGPGLFLSKGLCKKSCDVNEYTMNQTCYQCHSSCYSCSGQSNSECITCPTGKLINTKGVCVDHCSAG